MEREGYRVEKVLAAVRLGGPEGGPVRRLPAEMVVAVRRGRFGDGAFGGVGCAFAFVLSWIRRRLRSR